jgi:hypothetical protein
MVAATGRTRGRPDGRAMKIEMLLIPQPPPPGSRALFAPDFGQRFLVTVETEEEYDWDRPPIREGHGLDHLPRLAKFQSFCEARELVPLYLVDWPVATSSLAADILKPALAAGRAEIGLQLHPWVNPPHDEELSIANSFAGNLPRDLEAAKIRNLRDMAEETFGVAPLVYRAGGYGAGPHTGEILREQGLAIDTSVRPSFDYLAMGGPGYHRHPPAPYWLDAERSVLELPLTSVFWGMLRRQGSALFPALQRLPALAPAFARLGLLERVALTPEGVSVEQAIRGIDIALDDGLPLLVFSFHSPSLRPGHTPFVRNDGDLDAFYDWWRSVLDYCASRGVRPTTIGEIMRAVVR